MTPQVEHAHEVRCDPGLMDLPRELRDQIYEETFARNEDIRHNWRQLRGFPGLSLLCVCQQIREEALDRLLRKHRFYKVNTNIIGSLRDAMEVYGLEALAIDQPNSFEQFKHHFMSVELIHTKCSDPVSHIMMVERRTDVNWFFLSVARLKNHVDKDTPVRSDLRISIALTNPFSDAGLCDVLHARVLHSLVKHWWCFHNFSLTGVADRTRAAMVQEKVGRNRWSSANDLFKELVRQCKVGRDLVMKAKSARINIRSACQLIDRALKTHLDATSIIAISYNCSEGIAMFENQEAINKVRNYFFMHDMAYAEAALEGVKLRRNIDSAFARNRSSELSRYAAQTVSRAIFESTLLSVRPPCSVCADMFLLRAMALRFMGSTFLDKAIIDINRARKYERRGDCDRKKLRKIAEQKKLIRACQTASVPTA